MSEKRMSEETRLALIKDTPHTIDDPFEDISIFDAPMDYDAAIHTKKPLTHLSVLEKPSPQWWVQVTPDKTHHRNVFLLKDEAEFNTIYLVSGNLAEAVSRYISARMLYLSVTSDGNPFLWAVKVFDPNARLNSWLESKIEVIRIAQQGSWIQVYSDAELGRWVCEVSTDLTHKPKFPDKNMAELLELAFKDRVVMDLEHPVLRRIMGKK